MTVGKSKVRVISSSPVASSAQISARHVHDPIASGSAGAAKYTAEHVPAVILVATTTSGKPQNSNAPSTQSAKLAKAMPAPAANTEPHFRSFGSTASNAAAIPAPFGSNALSFAQNATEHPPTFASFAGAGKMPSFGTSSHEQASLFPQGHPHHTQASAFEVKSTGAVIFPLSIPPAFELSKKLSFPM